MSWLIFIILASAVADEDLYLTQSTVTKGAVFSQLQNVLLYSDTEVILEPLQDIPPHHFDSNHDCTYCGKELFNATRANHEAIKDTYDLIHTLSEIFSFRGLNFSNFERIHLKIKDSNFTADPDNSIPLPRQEDIELVGRTIYDAIVEKVESRNLHDKASVQGRRNERAIPVALGKFLPAALKLTSKLFLPKNGILNVLLGFANSKPDSLLNFAHSPNYVSEMSNVAIKSLQKVFHHLEEIDDDKEAWSKTVSKWVSNGLISEGTSAFDHSTRAAMEFIFRKLNSAVNGFKQEIAANFETSKQVGEVILLTNLLTQDLIHYNALQSCRDGSIPPTFLPPSLLKNRILSLLEIIPNDMELAFNLNDIQRLYTIKNTKCQFDEDGGLVEVTVPIKRKNENLHLYHLKSLYFAHYNSTCSINVESGHVAFESNSGQVYPIRRDDEDTCQPSRDGMCLINLV